MENKTTTIMTQDFKITLQQEGTQAVAEMAIQAPNAVDAMTKARRCMGKGWFVTTICQ